MTTHQLWQKSDNYKWPLAFKRTYDNDEMLRFFSKLYMCCIWIFPMFVKNLVKIVQILRNLWRTIWVLQRPPTITVPPNPDTRLRSGIGCFAVGHMWITSFSGGKHVQYIHDISNCFYTLSGLLNYNRSCMIVCEINLLTTITNND